MATLTIFHTNDLHDKLTPAKAEHISSVRASTDGPSLLLDAGDAVGSGNVTFKLDGEPILDVMSGMKYDAMVVGNREFHVSQTGFRAKTRRARFPVLCANVRPRSAGTPLPCVPFIRTSITGFGTAAVFGITVPMVTERMAVRHLSAYTFDDPEATGRELARRLRGDCALLICLSHAGLSVDRSLAMANVGIDLIVGGHTHAALSGGERHGDTLIVQAGSHARYFGRVTVTGVPGSLDLSAEMLPL